MINDLFHKKYPTFFASNTFESPGNRNGFENRKQKYNPGSELMTKIFLAKLHYSDLECTDWLENSDPDCSDTEWLVANSIVIDVQTRMYV